ncbi:hypothetical protein [Erythrobacter sp.]|uniref:hypothetical protein n=1 Tax=Erythrobacter sp. TaxID=1042 RepID=UPI0025E0B722|nr:hypothetical protein [Erythrobacter sp.]
MLFAPGTRPTRGALLDFVSQQHSVSLSHDPVDEAGPHPVAADGEALRRAEADAAPHDQLWIELLRDGLTFDLAGLAPGQSLTPPVIARRFDFAAHPANAHLEVLGIAPGPHLSAGARTMPVLRGMLALARDLALHFEDLQAVFWPPSGSAIGRRFFESVVTAWLEGGAFPALGLIGFDETADGALQSIGLAFWIGQELRIEPPLSNDKVAATRLGVRLINQLVIVGGITESERIIAPDGTRLVMQTSRNSEYIRVRRE